MARVLVVDDEEHMRVLYKEELGDEGHQVCTQASGHRLLETIERMRPDVVVLDIRLVDYDGLELLQEIRKEQYNLPVVLCSAYDVYRSDPRSIAADYYVVKSFDLSQLKLAIERTLEASALER